tara:strand:- start:415 stop:717 length:303 start_codon:yes stop_codon:yes gene_type:complete
MTQTVAECLTAATDSVTLINDVNTNGKRSIYIGGTADTDTEMSQADINACVQRNVDHLELILAYEPVDSEDDTPDVKNSSDDKSSYTSAITTGKAYIAAN